MRRQGKFTKHVTTKQHVKRQYRRHFRWWRRASWKKRALVVGGPILAVLILIPILTYLYFARDISDMDRLMNRNNTGIVFYADDGKTTIYSSGRAVHRDLTPLSAISPDMQHALIASEDKDFYNHNGFSVLSTLRAVYGYIVSRGKTYGGTTITQQLAKITLLGSNRTFLREYQTFSIAVAIENTYSKDQILDMYLNSAYFGEGAFGIQDAAKTYFGTTPDKLDLAQSAMLIGLLPAPSIYSPISGNATYAKERQATVLGLMVTNKYVTQSQDDAATAEKLTYQPPQLPINNSVAPHFVQMVLDQLYQKYGEETVNRSGYQVITTLDAKVQSTLQAAVDAAMPRINYYQGHNAAAVAIDPTDGEVRGLIGSYDWNNPDFGKVDVATSLRQPGSSFKPIYYSNALADGLITPSTILQDVPTDFNGYKPLDADKQFRGDVTVRTALNQSLNIPSVEVLQKYGISNTVDAAQRMGISSIKSNNNYGLSLALGSAEVTPLELTNAYAAFANQGKQFNTTIIKSIKTKYNEQVFKADEKSKQVISPQGAFLISNILTDNAAKKPVFGNTLTVYNQKTGAVINNIAIKTGTTNDDRDAWTVGYTPQLAIGVWVGNNDNSIMQNGSSIMAGPIFTKTMGTLMEGVTIKFPVPSGVVQRNVCFSNHGLSDNAVPGKTYSEWFLGTALPTFSCSVSSPSPSPSLSPSPSPSSSPLALSITLTADPANSAPSSANVTFTATLSDASSRGTVDFSIDGGSSVTRQVINGSAPYTTSGLPVGPHTITAVYTPADSSEPSSTLTATMNYTTTSNRGHGLSIHLP